MIYHILLSKRMGLSVSCFWEKLVGSWRERRWGKWLQDLHAQSVRRFVENSFGKWDKLVVFMLSILLLIASLLLSVLILEFWCSEPMIQNFLVLDHITFWCVQGLQVEGDLPEKVVGYKGVFYNYFSLGMQHLFKILGFWIFCW